MFLEQVSREQHMHSVGVPETMTSLLKKEDLQFPPETPVEGREKILIPLFSITKIQANHFIMILNYKSSQR